MNGDYNPWLHQSDRDRIAKEEQKRAKLAEGEALFHDDRITPVQMAQYVADVYQDAAPEQKMGIFGRILHRKKAKQQEAQNAQAKQKRATEEAGILSAAKQPGQAEWEADIAKKKAAIQALPALFPDASPEQLNTLKMHILGASGTTAQPPFKEYSSPDGKQRNWFRVGEQPEGWNAVQGEAKPGKGRHAWSKDAAGKIFSVLLDPATNQPVKGSENYHEQPPAGLTGRITTGFYHFVDDQGKVHQVEETHTSMPAGTASTRGRTGRDPAPKVATDGDKVLGRKDTAVTTKAKKDYVDAVRLDSVAKQVEQHPEDAVNQKRLAVALERQAAGRFTTQALDYIRKAGWSAGVEQFWNNIDNGTLPATVIRQLIEGAHQNLKAAKEAMDAAESLGGEASTPAPKADETYDDEFLKKVK